MRLVFVHHVVEDRGSAQDMHNYAELARALGHDVELYGSPACKSSFDYSLRVKHADALIFIFEWTTALQYGDDLDLTRLVATVPREHRVVIDCDGKYNDAVTVAGDTNHADAAASTHWVQVCDSLSDKILQPTLHPLRPNVKSFFFHAYNPAWEVPLEPGGKDFDMCYVGNNWFRWRSLRRVLDAVEPVRDRIGRIALVGHGWDSLAPWASPAVVEDAYLNDPEYLRRLAVEVSPPVPFHRVIECMSKGIFTPVIYRPLFDHLRLVTCRTFETPAANTIPLFCQAPEFVSEIYGDAALELTLPETEPHQKILDLLRRPQHYEEVVADIRSYLRETYSYYRQLQGLIEIVES